MMKKMFLILFLLSIIYVSSCYYDPGKIALEGSSHVSDTFFGFESNEKNPENCENLETESHKDTCLNIVALNTQNSTVCETIQREHQKNICYSGVASGLQDKQFCEKITSNSIQSQCLKNIS